MAERKSGPVKPPVIELSARPARDAGPTREEAAPKKDAAPAGDAAQQPAAATETSHRSDPAWPADPSGEESTGPTDPSPGAPAAQAESQSLWPAIGGAALAGAILGAVLSYGIAAMGWLPTLPSPQQAQMMSSLTNRVTALESKIGEANSTDTAAIQKLQQTVNQLQAAAPPEEPDLGPINDEIKTLSSRVDALNAGASSGDAQEIASGLDELRKSLAGLDSRVSALDQKQSATSSKLDDLSSSLTGLSGDIEQNRSALAAQAHATSQQQAASLRLPLLVSSLEDAFATGRPYTDELASLGRLAPEIEVPATVRADAATGLPQPQDLRGRLEELVPMMLAAAPVPPEASWRDRAAGWMRGILALRPAEAVAGDSPEAVLSRLEAAIDRGDFAAANRLMGQLPAPMREAAGDLPRKIQTAADAGLLLNAVRAQALSASAGTTS